MGLKHLFETLFVKESPPPPPPTGLADQIDRAMAQAAISVAKVNIATTEFRESIRAARARLNERG